MSGPSRWTACASSIAFAILCAALAGIAAIPWIDAAWASAAVALAFVPSGWWAGIGARRRVAEAALLPAAFAVTMVGGTVMRRMLLPPLLLLAAWAVVAAAWRRTPSDRRPLLAVCFGLSAQAAVGLGLTGHGIVPCALAFAVAAAAPWAAARTMGGNAAVLAALVAAVLPWQNRPVAAAAAAAVCLGSGYFLRERNLDRFFTGWLPGVAAGGVLAASLAPWPGSPLADFLTGPSWIVRAAVVAALLLTPRLRSGPAGAVWFLVVLLTGPALSPTPEHRAFDLTDDLGQWTMPAGTGGPYVIEVEVRGKTPIEDGTLLAVVTTGDGEENIFSDAAGRAVWRPGGLGRTATWRRGTRHNLEVGPGERPVLSRHRDLVDDMTVRVITVGPSRATPPRDWSLGSWVLAAAAVVALLQLLGGTWRAAWAGLPWLILTVGAMVARFPVEPLRLLGERLAVDVVLAAVLTAWLPAALGWLRRGRVFLTVVALLLPLAVATPHLTPSLYGDEPFHLIVMDSLKTDQDLRIEDDLHLEGHPQNQLYAPGWPLFQSPALALLLLPGYVLAGRTGALVLLVLMGAATVVFLARRAEALGVGKGPVKLLVLLTAVTYPLATFTTQIWSEVPGALAVAALLILAAGNRGGRFMAFFVAAGSIAVKTRLALLTLPIAAVVWLRKSRLWGVALCAAAAGGGLVIGWLTMGHPFGQYRRLHNLLPQDPALALRAIEGLAFDPAGGLAFTAPLILAALGGVALLWRRGGPGEQALLVGCGLTVAALLHSPEWYGGGAPPARYLVPMLPAFFLAGGMVLTRPVSWRRTAELLLPPSLIAWWVLLTRPHFSVNPGDGGYWLADALSRRFAVDGRVAFPSFLVPNTATLVVPAAILLAVAVVVFVRREGAASVRRFFGRTSIALWLAAASALVLFVGLRCDRVVEIEAPAGPADGGQPGPPGGCGLAVPTPAGLAA